MKPIAGALGRALRTLGLESGVSRVQAVDAWPAVATATLGAEGAHVRALRVDGDTLVLLVPTSSHAAEVRLREGALIAALIAAAPSSGVRRLRCAPGAHP
ncbi:MAG: DUF721 domain-containing protein [Chloroflexi bacterium]|nr:DUF721 domain-containing protein [Chloroflexota bacterium]